MKKKSLYAMVLMIIVISAIALNVGSCFAEEGLYVDRIEIEEFRKKWIKSWPPAIGCDKQYFRANVYMSDGSVANEDKFKDMLWKIERYDNVNKTYTTVATTEGKELEFWQPYGTPEGQYKITATSKVDSDAFGYTWYHLYYPWYTETFCICEPGKIFNDTAEEEEQRKRQPGAKDIKENWNWETKKYTCILPECPYKAKDYTFIGWKKDEMLYQPGDIYVAGYEDEPDGRNAYFEAQWKPNFKKPDVVANREGNKKIKLSWNRMIGGKGYKIYRATKKNGKYKLVKTVKNKLTTSWTDKGVKSGEIYYYKVVAYKKSKQHKSAWVQASTKAAKVKSVKLNQKSLTGAVGGSAVLKAKVKVKSGNGKVLSKKVRWYSSNKNVAKINERTGKNTFVSAGSCQVWAKAYNGKNNEKIKVIVTAPKYK